MARQVTGKLFADSETDLNRVQSIIYGLFEQIYFSPPTKSNQGDFFCKITIVLNGWENEKATIRQLLCLQNLGVQFDDSMTKGQASLIIKDQLARRRLS
jgi:hypothetical protein